PTPSVLVIYVSSFSAVLPSLTTRPPLPTHTLFPYTTLFRSCRTNCHCNTAFPSHNCQFFINLFRPFTATIHRINIKWLTKCKILDRKSTRLNSSHVSISYAVFCLKKQSK